MLGVAAALLTALGCVLIHSEAVILADRLQARSASERGGLTQVWLLLLCAHVVEIWLYAVVYWAMDAAGAGTITAASSLMDFAYYSAVVYTTLGFGDQIPHGDLRMLTGSEALIGLCLIAWSATVTYALVVSRDPS